MTWAIVAIDMKQIFYPRRKRREKHDLGDCGVGFGGKSHFLDLRKEPTRAIGPLSLGIIRFRWIDG